jgi:hypothetical protein
MEILLAGIVGSTAYGLATPDSDIDRLGVFAAPTRSLLGLRTPRESIVTTAPDRTLHEARKWCDLALGGNPTVMELVWLPDDLYETRTPFGDELIGIRSAFLSAKRVRDAYLGYATQQFRKLERRIEEVRKQPTGVSYPPNTLSRHEDVLSVSGGKEPGMLRNEPAVPRQPGTTMQGLHSGAAHCGIRPESGEISGGEEPPLRSQTSDGQAAQGHAGTAPETTSQRHLRDNTGGGGTPVRGTERDMPDMRLGGGSGGSLPHDRTNQGHAMPEVQSGTRALYGQSRDAREGNRIPDGEPHEVLGAERGRRIAKHARHLARLVHQGRELYATGDLRIRLDDPEWYRDFGDGVADGDIEAARRLLAEAEAAFDRIRTPLPERPDEATVEAWLLAVREAHYDRPPQDG